jgi:SAM-dependent methyltransferase
MPVTQQARTVVGMTHSHLAEMLDLDAEVLHEYHRDVITWAGSLTTGRPRIVDLGAGTGSGTFALARHLPGAEVTAVDVDEEMLGHLRHRAAERGLADRVRTVQADLDAPWPALGPADLLWASASMHHLADPRAALRQAYATLRPGGVFVVTELQSFPRFLPDGPEAEVEERCHAALARYRTEAGMHMHEDWGARLAEAGFAVEAERRFDIELRAPLPAATGRYAEVSLSRMRHRLEGRVSDADLAAMDRIAAAVAGRDDLVVRTVRTAWAGRRPEPAHG